MVCLHRLLLQVKTLTSTIVSGCEIISTPRFRQILEGLLEKLSGGRVGTFEQQEDFFVIKFLV